MRGSALKFGFDSWVLVQAGISATDYLMQYEINSLGDSLRRIKSGLQLHRAREMFNAGGPRALATLKRRIQNSTQAEGKHRFSICCLKRCSLRRT